LAAQVKIRPFQMDDMLRINLREIDMRTGTFYDSGVKCTVSAAEKGEALTLLVDDVILSIGGIVPLFPGVAEMWSLASKEVDRHPIVFHKSIIKILKFWEKQNELHRMQCKVFAGHDKSQKWLERMGFKNEGLMRKYDALKNDYYMYARVK
jgi:hypothetical protein